MKPIIGITCKDRNNIGNYTKTVSEFGGKPIVYASLEKSIQEHLAAIPDYIDEIDGLLLSGGGDIESSHFNQELHPNVTNVSRSRDALELNLCRRALETDIPVFGICRGIQVMSVAMNGSLYQDIETVYPKDALIHPSIGQVDSEHEILIEPGSLLDEIIGAGVETVNSAHHQSVDDIGEGFIVTARSSDGIIEAMENPSKTFVLGVQYHPERMKRTNEFREHRQKIFEAFLNAASKK